MRLEQIARVGSPEPKAIMRRRQMLLNSDISDEERRAFLHTLDKLEARAKEPVA